MSSSKSTGLVRIIPSQSMDDPATEHARRLTGLSVALDKPHVFEKGTTRSLESGAQKSGYASLQRGGHNPRGIGCPCI